MSLSGHINNVLSREHTQEVTKELPNDQSNLGERVDFIYTVSEDRSAYREFINSLFGIIVSAWTIRSPIL